jgi:DNA-binding CsgD family transcriptional regulator
MCFRGRATTSGRRSGRFELPGRQEREPTTRQDPDLDVTRALERVTVPAYVIDRQGGFRWLNRGALEALHARVGQPFSRAVAPEDVHLARAQFAKKLIGEAASTDYNLTLLGRDGERLRVRISSVPLWKGGQIIGVFGLAYPVSAARDSGTLTECAAAPELTARQYETLALLADGLGTAAIASRLGVAEETARNHIRRLLRQLDVHSRLEAVVRAYRLGLLQLPNDD